MHTEVAAWQMDMFDASPVPAPGQQADPLARSAILERGASQRRWSTR